MLSKTDQDDPNRIALLAAAESKTGKYRVRMHFDRYWQTCDITFEERFPNSAFYDQTSRSTGVPAIAAWSQFMTYLGFAPSKLSVTYEDPLCEGLKKASSDPAS